jgi:hypothetical protein
LVVGEGERERVIVRVIMILRERMSWLVRRRGEVKERSWRTRRTQCPVVE